METKRADRRVKRAGSRIADAGDGLRRLGQPTMERERGFEADIAGPQDPLGDRQGVDRPVAIAAAKAVQAAMDADDFAGRQRPLHERSLARGRPSDPGRHLSPRENARSRAAERDFGETLHKCMILSQNDSFKQKEPEPPAVRLHIRTSSQRGAAMPAAGGSGEIPHRRSGRYHEAGADEPIARPLSA